MLISNFFFLNLFYFSVQLCRALSENKNHDVGFRGELCGWFVGFS